MSSNKQAGYINPWVISLIFTVVLFLGAAGFGVWAFMSRQDYKDNSDQKSSVAVSAAVKKTQSEDAAKYAEEAKNPLKEYVGPSQYGSVVVKYPKTWSGYVITNSSTPLNAYFHPDVVPDVSGLSSAKTAFALRVQVVNRTYAQQMQQYEAQLQSKKVTVSPYALPKVPGVVGSRVDGQISTDNQGSIVILPLRNMSLMISTESQSFLGDFNNIILPNFTFSP